PTLTVFACLSTEAILPRNGMGRAGAAFSSAALMDNVLKAVNAATSAVMYSFFMCFVLGDFRFPVRIGSCAVDWIATKLFRPRKSKIEELFCRFDRLSGSA